MLEVTMDFVPMPLELLSVLHVLAVLCNGSRGGEAHPSQIASLRVSCLILGDICKHRDNMSHFLAKGFIDSARGPAHVSPHSQHRLDCVSVLFAVGYFYVQGPF